jgi:isopenicillin N synthase-like dioxygenase
MAPGGPLLVDLTSFALSAAEDSSAKAATAAALFKSASDYGYAHVAGHGVPPAATARLLSAARSFFQSRAADADDGDGYADIALSPDTYRGYQRLGENVTLGRRDGHRALDFLRSLPAGTELPAGASVELGEAVEVYMGAVLCAGGAVMRAVCHTLRLPPAVLDECFSNPFWILRLIHYPAAESVVETVPGVTHGCGAHRDYGWLTFVVTDEQPGTQAALEVSKDGSADGFAPAALPPTGGLLLNFGDCLEALTGGCFPATLHRVARPPKDRLSIAAFVEPNFSWRISPLALTLPPTEGVSTATAAGHRERVDKLQRFSCYGEYLLSKVSANFSIYNNASDET